MNERKKIEDRILQIISYINSSQNMQSLVGTIKLFSTEELLYLLKFLETWDYNHIYILVDKKIKEFLAIEKEIKQLKIWEKMKSIKQKEQEEQKQEEQNLDKLLDF